MQIVTKTVHFVILYVLLSTEMLDYVVKPMKYQAFLPHFGSMSGWCWVVGGGVGGGMVGYGLVGGGVVYGCLW